MLLIVNHSSSSNCLSLAPFVLVCNEAIDKFEKENKLFNIFEKFIFMSDFFRVSAGIGRLLNGHNRGGEGGRKLVIE
jgi:hypothetical protein